MEDAKLVSMLQAGQEDLQWFDSNLSKLVKEFNNKFIAFSNKEVIVSSDDPEKLIEILNKKGMDTSGVFIKFVSKVKSIL